MTRPLRDTRPLSVRVAEVADKLRSSEFSAATAALALADLGPAITKVNSDLGIVGDELVEFLYAAQPNVETALIQLDGLAAALADEAGLVPVLNESEGPTLVAPEDATDVPTPHSVVTASPIANEENLFGNVDETLIPPAEGPSVEIDWQDDDYEEPDGERRREITDVHGFLANDTGPSEEAINDLYSPQAKSRWPLVALLGGTLMVALATCTVIYFPERSEEVVTGQEIEVVKIEPVTVIKPTPPAPVPTPVVAVTPPPVIAVGADLSISPMVVGDPYWHGKCEPWMVCAYGQEIDDLAVAMAETPAAYSSEDQLPWQGYESTPKPTLVSVKPDPVEVPKQVAVVIPPPAPIAVGADPGIGPTPSACPPGTVDCTSKAHVVAGTAFLILRDQAGKRGQWVVDNVTVASDGGCLYRGQPVPETCLQVKEPGSYRASKSCPQRELLYWFDS